ncbi:MAG: dihydropteroate synthase [Gammaproteobacteria bacterium]|nr:dihydropteroate synthase [Gammaproteobacteria bacterium]
MMQHLLFVTGKLAEKSLARVLEQLDDAGFTWEIRVPGIAVAALLTADMLKRRLGDVDGFDRVILPGRCRGDLADLSDHFGLPFERGPEELKDLPAHFGRRARTREVKRTDVRLFAEIVDAPQLDIDGLLARAQRFRADGADVIDIGCLPDTPFPHLEDSIDALRGEGFAVSIDSLDRRELERGIAAGADYCFSLTAKTLELAEHGECTPVLIAEDPRDLDALCRTIERFAAYGRPFYADPVLDPVHYGFTASLERYAELRRRFPEVEIMMGIGNLSELTHADTLGINTLLLGIVSELRISAVLTTEVSAHCRSAIREVDRARRVMFAAREDNTPPRHIDESLLALHERHPFVYSDGEIAEFAREVRDDNFRIQVNASGIHVYNRQGLHKAEDAYTLYPALAVDDDAPHAFYLGLELARAEIAWQLGKRYSQDEELDWGCVRPRPLDDKRHYAVERSTLKARRARRKQAD